MTILVPTTPSGSPKQSYIINQVAGAAVTLPYNFKIKGIAELLVTINGIHVPGLVISGVGNTLGGSVVVTLPPGYIPGSTVRIYRDTVRNRTTDFAPGSLPSAVLNDDLDKVVAVLQELDGNALVIDPSTNTTDAKGSEIINLADGTTPTSAATVSQVDVVQAGLTAHTNNGSIHFQINDTAINASSVWSSSRVDQQIISQLIPILNVQSAHVNNTSIHALLNDSSTNNAEVWSSAKTSVELLSKASTVALTAHTTNFGQHRTIDNASSNATSLLSSGEIDARIAAGGGVDPQTAINTSGISSNVTNINTNAVQAAFATAQAGLAQTDATAALNIANANTVAIAALGAHPWEISTRVEGVLPVSVDLLNYVAARSTTFIGASLGTLIFDTPPNSLGSVEIFINGSLIDITTVNPGTTSTTIGNGVILNVGANDRLTLRWEGDPTETAVSGASVTLVGTV